MMLIDVDTLITYCVISAPTGQDYIVRSYGGEDDSEMVSISRELLESEKFITQRQ